MARHRRGYGSGHALEILQACEISESYEFDNPTTLLSVEPAIIDDELYLRIQQWIVFASGQLEKSVGLGSFSICNHFYNAVGTLRPILECKLQHHDTRHGCATCHPCLRCNECHTEFHVQTRDLGVDGSALVVTKWARLGHGLSPTDPHWRPHAYGPALYHRDYPVSPAADGGSLHARFERQAQMGMDALSAKQASLLRGKSYRRTFYCTSKAKDPDRDDFWIQSSRVERNAHRYNDYPFGSF